MYAQLEENAFFLSLSHPAHYHSPSGQYERAFCRLTTCRCGYQTPPADTDDGGEDCTEWTVLHSASKNLRWLPIQLRINYKILVAVHAVCKCLSNQASTYLQSILQRQTITRTTRTSQDQTRLVVPRTTKKIFADRSFSVVGQTV